MHLDGIHLHRATVVLISVSGGHVVGWHVARSETCSAWSSLLSRIAPPHRRASRTSEQPPSGWRRTTSESGTSPDSSTRRAVGRTASSRTSTCTWPRPAGWCTDGSGMGSHSRSSTRRTGSRSRSRPRANSSSRGARASETCCATTAACP